MTAGVYAICHGNRVYVGETNDIERRGTIDLAQRLGLDWGVIRELNGESATTRRRHEKEVIALFIARGFEVVTQGVQTAAWLEAGRRYWATNPEARAERLRRLQAGRDAHWRRVKKEAA